MVTANSQLSLPLPLVSQVVHRYVARQPDCLKRTMAGKYIVYVLKTLREPTHYYTGLTSNLAARLDKHNAGGCRSTALNRPWKVDVVIEFSDERRAVALEKYLKTGSGVAFASRHLR
jgi:putative endonuclease